MRNVILILAILTTFLAVPQPVNANTPKILSPTWTSVIAYYNPNDSDPGGGGVDNGTAEMNIIYYKSAGGFESSGYIPILPHHSGVMLVGSTSNFNGAAVISSNLPIFAVYKQESSTREPFSPILYTSFDLLTQAGEGIFYLPSVQRTEQFDTQIAIQNIESYPIEINLDFYGKDHSTFHIEEADFPGGEILSQSSRIFKASEITALPVGFDGSLVINGHEADSSRQSNIVAVAQDSIVGGRQTFIYEGVGEGAQKVFLPAVFCQFGTSKQSTRLWVQNTASADPLGINDTVISVNYFQNDTTDGLYASLTTPEEIVPGESVLIDVCDPTNTGGIVTGRSFSAVVEVNNSQASIAVVGKTNSKDGLYTAYTGQPALDSAKGSDDIYRVVLPYVEYSLKYGFKTYIYVQNASTSEAVDDVDVKYYPHAGGDPVVHKLGILQPGSMLPSDPSKARAYDTTSRGFFGAVVIESTHPIAALARVQSTVSVTGATTLGEEYSGMVYKKP